MFITSCFLLNVWIAYTHELLIYNVQPLKAYYKKCLTKRVLQLL